VLHARLLPLLAVLCIREGLGSHVVRTNQSFRAWHIVRAARLWRRPVVLRCGYVRGEVREALEGRTNSVSLYQKQEGWAFRNATRCHVPSERLRAWVIDRYAVTPERVDVIPNYVNLKRFPRREDEVSIARSVVSIGRLVPDKRFDLLLRGCHEAGASMLTIVGEGLERTRLEELANGLGFSLNCVGRIPNCEVPDLLRRHQVYAHVSRWEGQPKAVLEGMAGALPVVVAGAEGSLELVRDGETGLWAASNPHDVARAIRHLFENRGYASRLGEAARAYVTQFHSLKRIAALQINAYRQILDARSNSAR